MRDYGNGYTGPTNQKSATPANHGSHTNFNSPTPSYDYLGSNFAARSVADRLSSIDLNPQSHVDSSAHAHSYAAANSNAGANSYLRACADSYCYPHAQANPAASNHTHATNSNARAIRCLAQ